MLCALFQKHGILQLAVLCGAATKATASPARSSSNSVTLF